MTIKQCFHLFAALSLFLFCRSVMAELPHSFTATYELNYDDLRIGVMQRQFSRNSDGSGTFESNSHLTGLAALFRKDKLNEKSRWEIHDGQIRPVEYTLLRSGGDSIKMERHVFDWRTNRIHTETSDGKKVIETKPGTLDKLLYQIAIMNISTADHTLEFNLVDGFDLKTYVFEYLGEEELKTPMGKLQTVKFARKRNDESKRSTLVWCAPELKYLPVRVDNVDKKGHLTSIVLKEVSDF